MPSKKQSIKGLDRWTPEPYTGMSFSMDIISENQIAVQCPYCLYEGKRVEFLIRSKSGKKVLMKTFQCPDCKVMVHRETLMRTLDLNITNYAKWIYSVRQFDTDRRVKWDKIKERLRNKGLTSIFWDAYYAVKTKDLEERMPDWYVEKKAEEYAKQWQPKNQSGQAN